MQRKIQSLARISCVLPLPSDGFKTSLAYGVGNSYTEQATIDTHVILNLGKN